MIARAPLQRLIDTLLGTTPPPAGRRLADPAIDEAAHLPEALITTQRASRPLARNALVPDALRRAIEDFIASEARTYVNYHPNTRYRVDQITTYITPENRRYLADLGQLKRKIRNGVALTCIDSADGARQVLDTSGFGDWCIEPAPEASADDQGVYTVLAGSGPEQVPLSFVVFGEYIEREAGTAKAPLASALAADQTATLDIAALAAGPPALLTLRIQEPGLPERQQALHQLPALIGRGSACTVRLDSPFASRMHACIRVNANGQLVIDATTAKGVRCNTVGQAASAADELAPGQTLVLPPAGSLVLTPGAGPQAVVIRFEQARTAADHTATLAPPPEHPLPHTGRAGPPAGGAMPAYLGNWPVTESSKPMHLAAARHAAPPTGPAPTTLRGPGSAVTAVARLLVRHGDGSTEQHLIHSLPFVIGREPDGAAGLALRDPASRSSREHLRLIKLQGGSILTENLAATKGGSWAGGEALAARFAWCLQAAGGRSGWVTLGQKEEGGAAVMVRIEHLL